MASESDTPLPLSYRSELLARMMPRLRAGECCSLVGISGVGKSNLVAFLQRRDVQEHYWGANGPWLLMLDANGMLFRDAPGDYDVAELMIHRVITEAERRSLPGEFVDGADKLHTQLVGQPSAQLALRYLERLCDRLCGGQGQQVIFAFDQFDDIWRDVNARFFANLRYLRDRFKYRLVYLVLTRDPLQRLRPDKDVEAFRELFTAHVFGIGMYTPQDAHEQLRRLAGRRGVELRREVTDELLSLSGCHPALLRALFWATDADATVLPARQDLLAVPSVTEVCAQIWGDLTADERHVVHAIAQGQAQEALNRATCAELRLKEVVVGEDGTLFSPLFCDYVLRQERGDMAGVVVEPKQRLVWIDGQPVKEPGPKEFALLEYLARHAGAVCKTVEVLEHLYPGEKYYSSTDQRLDAIVSRLRDALGTAGRRYVVRHRGVGVQLTQGRAIE